MKILPTYFSPLLPVIITGPGQYKTREGITVVIDRQNGRNFWQGVYLLEKTPGIREDWDRSGRIWPNKECINDIVEKLG